ncbi:uncharacterized protein BDZ99DRAFT_59569 [Mytilinidion resinicola]|uniref:Phospholipid/glycerol acyltransferase domain-containing protein n=1 Tax=Mytilinidion resinicola TaxID=574789 RepID=A0A6A6YJ74_9PEZI|nr:uncharacterized protein BDZ99DRAFT_59569 [Mytilinidion resinicola]KAF2808619.1 hypothetical protein BDZ99DRAFT_59569 [Mytilinidion resinicola]
MPLSPLAQLRGLALLLPWTAYLLGADVVLSLLLPLKLLFPTLVFNASSLIANSVWAWVQGIFVTWNRASITISSNQRLPKGESAIVVANHVSWSDFYLIQEVAQRSGMLGLCRWFAKKSLRWVPFLGWGLWAMGMPLVSRNWTKDERELEKVFRGVVQKKWPVWLISYSEGTRLTPAKQRSSIQWSRDHNRPVMKHVLYPRMHGFVATVNALRHTKHVRAVYDMTIAYAHGQNFMQAPSFWDTFTTNFAATGYRFYVHVDRYPIAELPETAEGLSQWLETRWVQKGNRLDDLKRKLERGEEWEADELEY